MEIIKRGELPEEKVLEGSCTRCKTVIRFRAGEAKYVSDQRDGDFYQIACPVCSHLITRYVHSHRSSNWYEDH